MLGLYLLLLTYTCTAEESAVCEKGTFQCGNTTICVEQHKHCDGVRDCPDGDDESYSVCGKNNETL